MADDNAAQEREHHQQQAAAAAAAFHALQSPPAAATHSTIAVTADGVNAAVLTASAPRGPYRGKCLYKTGKCPNERALKTSGAAHNLCDDHRRRQNEHQRKLDSKNRNSRRDKRSRAAAAAAGFLPDDLDAESVAAAVGGALVGDSTAAADKRAAAKSAAKAAASGTFADIAPVMTKAIGQPSPMPGVGASAGATAGATVDSKGTIMSTGAQPPQMTYPFMMQDFDGVVVPLPSYVEGNERVEFRARIYQKVLDFIAEECIRRFGGKLATDSSSSMPAPSPEPQMRAVNALSPVEAVQTGAYFAAQALQQQQQQQQQQVAAAALATEREKRGARVKPDDAGESESEGDADADDLRDAKKLRVGGGGARSSRKTARSEV